MGLLYISLLVNQRARLIPYFFIGGFAGDQLIRAFTNTLDPAFVPQMSLPLTGLSILLIVLSVINWLVPADEKDLTETGINHDHGLLSFWGAVGLGGLLFLQLSLLALPNAITGRANTDYTTFAPLLLVATLLPLVPFVRTQARQLLSPFDSTTRGWVWLILLALLLVIGVRLPVISNIPAGGIALVLAQFAASLLWWWPVRPKASDERNLGGLWLAVSVVVVAFLLLGDVFTYEYAFVRDFAPPLDALNPTVPNLLRGFRGLGIGVILIAAFLSVLPMIQATRRVPWRGGSLPELVTSLLVIMTGGALATAATLPPVVSAVTDVSQIRVGTYNIHAGYSEFYEYNLEGIARAIEGSGASVVLLQEVEAGRLTSYGTDQSLWLARRLGMDRRFYPTNEGLRGLAVLSRIPIVFDDGVLLPGIDEQTGLQRVQVQPDEGAITIYNTSLGLLLQGDNLEEQESNQRTQLRAILSIIEQHIENDYGGTLGRALLGGTFHNVPDSPLVQTLRRTGFFDPFAGLNLELSATLERVDRRARVDYIWLWGQTLQSVGTGIIRSDASDHRMAFVEVQISTD
jgi:endonuclease/exonuclease/phosphatase family metal-dependent hydrolase